VGVHPQRHREQLIRGLDDDGLEELTLRLARKEYPEAHRTGRGRDGGIDVLSDLSQPPARGWQSKTSTSGRADWAKCRTSIQAAMAAEQRPRHYTFVFNHALAAPQRNSWRDKVLPELRAAYPDAETIDYWDDLDRRVEDHPELIAWLTDGAFGTYVRRTLEQTAESGVNPLASAVDVSEGLGSVAEHARAVGRDDPRFAYGVAGREADAGDAELGDRVAHFTMTAGQRDALPTFRLTVREGELVHELTARPRANVEVRAPEPWFADSDEGRHARAAARASLAKGRPIALSGPHVGIASGDVPDRFAGWTDPERPPGRGELELGVSEPLELTLTLAPPGMGEVAEPVRMHRVPPEPGAELAYAGAVGATVLAVDVAPGPPPPGQAVPEGGRWVHCTFSVTLAVHGEPSRMALRGLGFAQAFGSVDHLHFDCPGLLPAGGYDVHGRLPIGEEEAETWQVAATLALALNALTQRDSVERVMPEAVGPRDLARAEMVLHLVAGEPVAVAAEGEFRVPLPPAARAEDDPVTWRHFTAELPPLVGQRTGLHVEQRVEDATLLRIEQTDRGSLALICRAADTGAAIVRQAVPPP
jgi:hypothetical protein